MTRTLTTLLAPLTSVWRYRKLVKRLTEREIAARYRGSLLGVVWAVVIPLVMLVVYTFVFSVVFKARWGSDGSDRFEFALMLFCGLVVFNIFADCISRSPTLILSNVSYVKKVVFPLEVLPWVTLCSALFNAAINVMVLLVFALFAGNSIPATVFLLPVVILPFVFLLLGLSFFLSSLGVFIRDLQQVVGVVLTCVMFLSPVFYPVEALPGGFQRIVALSPLSTAVTSVRDVLLRGTVPALSQWSASAVVGVLAAIAGSVWFSRTRKAFADVM